jgi:hypothetical protein
VYLENIYNQRYDLHHPFRQCFLNNLEQVERLTFAAQETPIRFAATVQGPAVWASNVLDAFALVIDDKATKIPPSAAARAAWPSATTAVRLRLKWDEDGGNVVLSLVTLEHFNERDEDGPSQWRRRAVETIRAVSRDDVSGVPFEIISSAWPESSDSRPMVLAPLNSESATMISNGWMRAHLHSWIAKLQPSTAMMTLPLLESFDRQTPMFEIRLWSLGVALSNISPMSRGLATFYNYRTLCAVDNTGWVISSDVVQLS